MANVLDTSAGERDFTEALCWYAERSQQAAGGFDAEFQRTLEQIAADPERFAHCDDVHRFYLMRRYPYHVIYRAREDELIIVAVAHAKRRPGYWRDQSSPDAL